MKNISDLYESKNTIFDRINENLTPGEPINEGLKDWFNAAKEKLSQVADKIIQGVKGIYAKFKCYIIPVDKDGNLLPTVGGYTCGEAYKDGKIDKKNTFVYMDPDGQKITGLKNKPQDAKKQLYGNETTLKYWDRIVKESAENNLANVNEVKLESEDPMAKYNRVVDADELEDEIKYALTEESASLMIWGAPGIGKTAILDNVLKKFEQFKGYKLICKTLSNETPDNFTLPSYVDIMDENGNVTRRAEDIPKTWMPVYKPTGDTELDKAADEACGKGLLFIDELSRATEQVRNVILPLINEHRFNGFKLGSGWTIICASNRDEDELTGQTEIGNALSNRFAHIYFEPTFKSWKKWAEKQNFISPLLLQWLGMPENEEFAGGKFYYMDPNEELVDSGKSTKIMCTPRSWTNAMRELATRDYTGKLEGFDIFNIKPDIIAKRLNKHVPATAVDSFLGFLDIVRSIGDFDRAVDSVWNNNGADLKIGTKELRLIEMPLAQLIICARGAQTLPSEKEFNSLVNWLIKTNNAQLTSYVIDIFKNVYADTLRESAREDIFIARDVYDSADKEIKERMDKNSMAKLLQKYGLKNCGEIPDYNKGVIKLADKYKDIFLASTIDGKSVLF